LTESGEDTNSPTVPENCASPTAVTADGGGTSSVQAAKRPIAEAPTSQRRLIRSSVMEGVEAEVDVQTVASSICAWQGRSVALAVGDCLRTWLQAPRG